MLDSRPNLVLCLLVRLDERQVWKSFDAQFLLDLLPVSCPVLISFSLLNISLNSIIIISYDVHECARILWFFCRWMWSGSPWLVMLSPVSQGRETFRPLFFDLTISRNLPSMSGMTLVLILHFTLQFPHLL